MAWGTLGGSCDPSENAIRSLVCCLYLHALSMSDSSEDALAGLSLPDWERLTPQWAARERPLSPWRLLVAPLSSSDPWRNEVTHTRARRTRRNARKKTRSYWLLTELQIQPKKRVLGAHLIRQSPFLSPCTLHIIHHALACHWASWTSLDVSDKEIRIHTCHIYIFTQRTDKSDNGWKTAKVIFLFHSKTCKCMYKLHLYMSKWCS